MLRTSLFALTLAAALAGCATGGDRPRSAGSEFVGRTVQVQAANGQLSTMRFAGDGTVRASFNGREAQGRWAVDGDELCFTWAGNFRECWPYETAFRRGQTRSITSSRGNAVRVTLQ